MPTTVSPRRASTSAAPYDLLRRFSWLSFVSISIVLVVSSFALSRVLTDRYVSRDATLAMEYLQSVADVEAEGAYRAGHAPDLRDRDFAEFFVHVSRLPDVLRANIYTTDRTLIWSSDERLARGPVAQNAELDAAIRGELEYELAIAGPDDPKPEHADLTHAPVRYIEMYVPLKDKRTGNIIGVAELYRVPSALFDAIREGTQLIWGFALAGGLALYLALFWIVRRADRTIRAQRERLVDTERLAAVGELSTAVAHGIRNPLSSIRTSAELCLHEATPGVRDAAQDIIATVDNAERWVRDLLDSSRSDRSVPVSVDLRPVIERAEQAFRRECGRRHIRLSSQLPSRLPPVNGDEALLEHVFCSLLANAVDAMPQGGRLDVSAQIAEDGKAVSVTVADTGHGITPQQLSRMFTPYVSDKPNGMGLGLSLVRHIVRRLGGDVRIESQPQQGTRVILELGTSA